MWSGACVGRIGYCSVGSVGVCLGGRRLGVELGDEAGDALLQLCLNIVLYFEFGGEALG